MNDNNRMLQQYRDMELTKYFIKNDRYGKFDLLERLIPKEKLLSEKTRVLLIDVLALLGMAEKDFPYTGFKMWISRYRRNNAPPPASIENNDDQNCAEKREL
jgi:hypothetical protein